MEIDGDGRIHRFLQARIAPAGSRPTAKLMFTGVQVLEPTVFSYMEAANGVRKFSTTKDTYPRMLLRQERLFGFRFDGFWQDVKRRSGSKKRRSA
jgi:NDP-sugar pyrophosphorylase family protein